MFFSLAIFVILIGAFNSQTVDKNLNKLVGHMIPLDSSDTLIMSVSQRTGPLIIRCPATKKCDILCRESPIASLTPGATLSSSCGGATIIAGNVPEVKVICLENACRNTVMQLSSSTTNVECIGPNACTGAKILCGAQSWNKFLHIPVPMSTRFEKCHITCTNGGCAGDHSYFQQNLAFNNYEYHPFYGHHTPFGNKKPKKPKGKAAKKNYLPGTLVHCAGAITDCRVKANSQVQDFPYGRNAKKHLGSFNKAKLICNIMGIGSCNMECSDTLGVHYCNGMTYDCRTPNPRKCRCYDYCVGNPGSCAPFNIRVTPDCGKLTLPTPAPTPSPK